MSTSPGLPSSDRHTASGHTASGHTVSGHTPSRRTLAGLGVHSVVLIGVAAILIDMAVQTTLILGQHTVYALDPAARARLNSAFIATFFVGAFRAWTWKPWPGCRCTT
jgi:hypothetical protein